MTIKVSEELGIGEVPETTRVVGHNVGLFGNVVVSWHVTVSPLMQRVETEQIGPGGRGSGRPLVGPRQGGPVVGGHPQCAFRHVMGVGQHVLVGHQGRQFQVRN